MASTVIRDRSAAILSLSCVAHCVALPIAAVSLPALALAAEAEWIHRLLTALALIVSTSVIASAHSARRPSFLLPALCGMAMLAFALVAEGFGVAETPPTVLGGLLLAAAHLYRLKRHP